MGEGARSVEKRWRLRKKEWMSGDAIGISSSNGGCWCCCFRYWSRRRSRRDKDKDEKRGPRTGTKACRSSPVQVADARVPSPSENERAGWGTRDGGVMMRWI